MSESFSLIAYNALLYLLSLPLYALQNFTEKNRHHSLHITMCMLISLHP